MNNLDRTIFAIKEWHNDRNLILGSDDKTQFCKLISEVGELGDNIAKKADIRDDIGDIIVVLINIAERNGHTIEECVNVAYNDIKDRKGVMFEGVFIKSSDAAYPTAIEAARLQKSKAMIMGIDV